MIMTKKRIIYSILALVLIVLIAAGGAYALRTFKKTSSGSNTQSENTNVQKGLATEDEAAAAIADAKKARAAGEYDKAKTSYQKALDYYKGSDNTQKIAEIDAVLNLLDVEKRQAPPKAKPVLAGQE